MPYRQIEPQVEDQVVSLSELETCSERASHPFSSSPGTPIVGNDEGTQAARIQQMTNGRLSRAGDTLLQLQNWHGNRHVQQVVKQALTIQPKLMLGAVDTPHEQEADQIAREVTNRGQLATRPTPVSGSATAVSPEIESEINQARSGGQTIDQQIRAPIEQAFGADFSHVRVHRDGRAHTLNQALEARAFTTGQDIFFRQGAYEPGSTAGENLLAHELAHVAQQNHGTAQTETGETVEKQAVRSDMLSHSFIQRIVLQSDGKTPYEDSAEKLHRKLFKVDKSYEPNLEEIAVLRQMLTDKEDHVFQWGMGLGGKKFFLQRNREIISDYKPPRSTKKKKIRKEPETEVTPIDSPEPMSDLKTAKSTPPPKKTKKLKSSKKKEAPTKTELGGKYVVETTKIPGFVIQYEKKDEKRYKGFKDYIDQILHDITQQSAGQKLIELINQYNEYYPFEIKELWEKSMFQREKDINQYLKKHKVRVMIQQPAPAPKKSDKQRVKKQEERVIETQSEYPFGLVKSEWGKATPLPKVIFFFPPLEETDFVGSIDKDVKVSQTHVIGHGDFAEDQPVDVILYHEFVHSLLTPIPWQKRFDTYKITAEAALKNIPNADEPAKRGNAVEEMMVSGLWYGRGFQWSENVYRKEKEYDLRETYKAVGLTKSDKGSDIKIGSFTGSVEDQIAQVLKNAGIPEAHAEYIAKGKDKPKDYEEI